MVLDTAVDTGGRSRGGYLGHTRVYDRFVRRRTYAPFANAVTDEPRFLRQREGGMPVSGSRVRVVEG